MLRHTYELYLDPGDGRRVFEALTCLQHDLVSEVRRILDERGVASIAVHTSGSHLLTLKAGEA